MNKNLSVTDMLKFIKANPATDGFRTYAMGYSRELSVKKLHYGPDLNSPDVVQYRVTGNQVDGAEMVYAGPDAEQAIRLYNLK